MTTVISCQQVTTLPMNTIILPRYYLNTQLFGMTMSV